jgi:D-alanine--poly(phosphoribitol) ligase subunit 1
MKLRSVNNLGISFERIVNQYSKNVALRFSSVNAVSYQELNMKANQFAKYLLDIGVNQTDVVCVSGNKKASTFTCMIGCLKMGAIYSMLDPESPVERLRKIIKTCNPKVLFVEPGLGKKLHKVIEDIGCKVIENETDFLESRLKEFDQSNLIQTQDITGTNPAYIMFTSGSTGFPKGAVMTHANVLNLIAWSLETYNISADEILTNVNPLYFDNSVFDFYSSLFSGASMVPFTKEIVTDPKKLVEMIDELKCTSWFSVPSMLIFLDTMKVFNKQNMKEIKRFIFGGEGYPKAKLKRLFDTYGDRAEIHNVYGPTECTCICSSYKICSYDLEDLKGLPPLGNMSDNFSYLILDEKNDKVQDGEVGELCLLGPNVGKGYYNDHERTQTSFIQNPYNDNDVEIMYKTGDMVKYNPDDDKIYIMGRRDNQIKHMGYRIELEEIETALSSLEYVSQAAVLHGTIRGLSQIIAVVSSNDEIHETLIRNDLKTIIPDYMIPSKVCIIDKLPRNPNGKIDRWKLRELSLFE